MNTEEIGSFKKFFIEVFHKMTDVNYLVNLTAEWIIFIFKIIICTILYYIAVKLIKKIVPLLGKNYSKNKGNASLNSFLKSILNFGLHGILITICLLILGVKETSLFAFFGTLGIGIGLALKDNLSNLPCGFLFSCSFIFIP